MVAIRKDLTADSGATFTVSVQYRDSGGVPVNLTGYTASFVLATAQGIAIETLVGQCTAQGWINVVATDEQTLEWDLGKQAYFLDLQNASGAKDRLFFGNVNVRFSGLNYLAVMLGQDSGMESVTDSGVVV